MDEEKSYITVKEFAKRAGVTTQRIYQMLGKDLQEYYTIIKGVKMIDEAALSLFDKNDFASDLQGDFANILQVLQSQLVVKDEQISEKDKQIEQLQSELAAERKHSREEVEKLTAALTAAQALHAADKQQQLMLTEKSRSGFLQRFIEFFKKDNGES